MEQFQIGDVVALKSGGPSMTVVDVGNDSSGKPTVWCEWFTPDHQQVHKAAFPVQAVKKIKQG